MSSSQSRKLAAPNALTQAGPSLSTSHRRVKSTPKSTSQLVAAVESARGKVVKWPTMGGSFPLGAMERAANTHVITIPITNHDNNQHSLKREHPAAESLERNRNDGGSAADGQPRGGRLPRRNSPADFFV
jgi:hypothetical protein